MSTVTIFRKYKNALVQNDLDPKDRATIQELKAKLKKASDDMDDHEGAASYEAAFKAAQKQYDDFMNTVSAKK